MKMFELMTLLGTIADDAKAALLSTVDTQGVPQMRWVTPGCVPNRSGSIFIVTALQFDKVAQLTKNPQATMLFQTLALDKIVNIAGTVSVLKGPLILSEVLEVVGKRLSAFWKRPAPQRELLVLEFVITSASLYLPQTGDVEWLQRDGEGQ